MSTTVDERVVEMRFDNKQFEANVQTSLSTLDKLKQKLNLSGASKGLDNLNSAANKVNMRGLGSAVETVTARFSALEVMGVTALANITNSAVNAGKKMVSALTIEPVKSGFQEYETQINAVQTILANTSHAGTTLKEVNAALDELNTYADKTIYNFTEMTRNIGTFTAAGVDLNTSVTAIQGIANLAAVSGSTSQQASTAMYQLSQALAAGTVKLMDWNSVVNAGMGGKVFQDALTETARVHGIAIDSMIEEQGSFRETLSEGWLTSEILTETLEKFTMTTEGLTEAEIEANREKLRNIGYTEEQIDEIFKLGQTSTDAATKVKTFTQLWDVLKESAQSGWTKTWQLLIGDFEEAKSLLTSIADVFTSLINKMSDARNNLLESALGMGFDKLQKSVSTALGPIKKVGETVDTVTESLEDLGTVVDNVILGKFGNGQERYDKLTAAGENYYKVQNKINETLGNNHRYTEEQIAAQDKLLSGQQKTTEQTTETTKATNKLTDAQKKQLKKMVTMSEEQAKSAGYTKKQVEALRDLKKTADKLGMPLDEFIDKMDEINGRWLLINSFKNIGESIAGVFKSIGKAFRDVFDPIKPEQLFNAIAALHKFTAQMTLSDSTAKKLRQTFRGLFAAIDIVSRVVGSSLKLALGVVSALCKAFGVTILDVTAKIGNLIYKFDEWIKEHDVISKFIENIAEKIPPLVDKVQDFVKSLWVDSGAAENFQKIAAALESIWNVVYGQFKIGLNSVIKLITSVLSLFGTNLGEIIGKVADWIVLAVDWIDANTLLINGLSKIAEIIQRVITGIANCAKAFWKLEPVQKVVEKIKNAFSKLVDLFDFDFNGGAIQSLYDWVNKVFTKIETWVSSLDTSEAFQKGLNIVEGLAEGISSGASKAIDAIRNIGKKIIDAICGVLGIHSPSTVMIAIGAFIIAGLVQGLISGENELFNALKSMFSNVLDTVVDFLQNGFPYAVSVIKGFLTQIGNTIKNGEIDWSALFVAGTIGAATLMTYKLLKILEKIAKPLGDIGSVVGVLNSAIKDIAKAKKMELYSKAIRNIAISIGILAAAVYLLAQLDYGKLWSAVGAITVLTVVMGALMFALSKFGAQSWESTASFFGLAAFLLSLGGALLMVSNACETIGGISWDGIKKCAAMLVLVGVLLVAMMGLTSYTSKKGFDSNVWQLAALFLGFGAALKIMASAMKTIAGMSEGDIDKGIAFISAVSIFCAGLVAMSKFAGESADKAGSMLLKMAIAIGILALVCKLIGSLSADELDKGIGFIAIVSIFCAGLVAMSKFAGESASKAGTMLLKMAIAIGILALVCKLVGSLSVGEIGKGIVFIGLLGVFMYAMIKITNEYGKDVAKVGTTLLGMAAAIAILAIAIRLVAGLSLEEVAKGLAFIAVVEALFYAIIEVSNVAGQNADKAGTMLLKMSVAILILVGAIAILSLLKPGDVILGTVCISLMLGMFALILKASQYAQSSMKSLIVMAVCIGILGGVLITLSCLDPTGVAVATGAISAMLGMFSLLLVASKFASKVSPSVLILLGVVAGLAAMLYLLNDLNPENALGVAKSMSLLLLAMSAALALLSLVGAKALVGAVALRALTIVMYLLVGVLAIMNHFDIAPSIETAKALSILLLGMSAACIVLGAVGVIGGIAIAGAVVLAEVITALGAFIAAIGWLTTKIPQLEEFLNAGMPIIEKIGYTIGSFLGNIVGGFTSGATSGLSDMATNLSDFITNLQPFIDGVKSLDGDIVTNIEGLAKAILALTAGDLLNSLTSFFGGGLEGFGEDLVAFGEALVDFSNVVGGINQEAITAAVTAAESLVDLSTTIGGNQSWYETLLGKTDMGVWGENLENFGSGLVAFSKSITGDNAIDTDAISAAVEAAQQIVPLSESISADSKWYETVLGKSDLGTWGENLANFGSGLVAFSNSITGDNAIDADAISEAVDAAQLIVPLSETISGDQSWYETLLGKSDLGTWGENLAAFGTGLSSFSASVSGENINADAISSAIEAATSLVELSEIIGKNTSWYDNISVFSDMETFGSNIEAFGESMSAYGESVADVNIYAITGSVAAAKALVQVANAAPKDGKGQNDLKEFGTTAKEFAKKLKDSSESFGDVDSAAINSAVTSANKLVKLVNSTANINTSGVSKFQSAVDSMAQTNLDGFVSTFNSSSSKLSSVGTNMINSLTKGLNSGKSQLSSSAKTITSSLVKSFSTTAKSLTKSGQQMASNLAKGIKSKASTVKSAASSASKQASSGAKDGYNSFYNAGYYLVQGFARGIRNSAYLAAAAARYAAQAAKDAINKALKINSPAKALIPSGSAVVEGLAKGILDNLSYVKSAGVTVADYTRDTISNTIDKASSVFAMDIDAEPTIRPVVDLSAVESGASRIGELMNVGSSVSALSSVGRVNALMNRRNQNGTNSDVVSAIDKLRKDLGNVGNTYNTIGDIAYSEGGEVDAAIKALIRAAKMERRV